MYGMGRKTRMPGPGELLSGRTVKMPVPSQHFVNGHPLEPPCPEGMETALFGLECFWGRSANSGKFVQSIRHL
jgi:peptide-methionine (S)-S-oxide reductase